MNHVRPKFERVADPYRKGMIFKSSDDFYILTKTECFWGAINLANGAAWTKVFEADPIDATAGLTPVGDCDIEISKKKE